MADDLSPSLRDALAASFDADQTTSTPDAAPASPSPESTPAAAPSTGGRDASGRFAPSPPANDTGAAPAADPDAAPEGYNSDLWAQLTPEARAATSAWAGKQRETLAERETRLKGYEPLDRVLTQQRRDLLTQEFGGVDQALERIFQLSDMAGRDPSGFLRLIAQQRGIDLASLVQGQGAPQGQQQAEPTALQLIEQAVEQRLQSRDVDQAYQAYLALPGLEHRDHPGVKRVMAALLQSGAANDYRQAYDMAAQAHPEIGPKLRAAEAANAAKAETERRAQAAAGKASAAVSTVGAPGTSRAPGGEPAHESVRSAVLHAFAREPSGRS